MANLNIDPVNFSENLATGRSSFITSGGAILYRIGDGFDITARYKKVSNEDYELITDPDEFQESWKEEQTFVVENCRFLFKPAGNADDDNLSSEVEYHFNEGEVYLFAKVKFTENDSEVPFFQLIPLAPTIEGIVTNDSFKDRVEELVNSYNAEHEYITRNQLRIRSNNIQAWVVNNFIAKTGKGGASNYTPGTLKVSSTDNKFDYLKDKVSSSDNSVEFSVIGRDNEDQKLDIRAKLRGIAFADVEISSTDWTQVGDYYEIELKLNEQVRDAISTSSDYWYTFIKGLDAYIRVDDNTLSEFSVDRIYAEETISIPGIDPFPRKFLKKIRAREAHNVNLVLYLTNGTVAKDSGGGGGGGEPDNYLVRARVVNNTLTLYPNSGSAINFTPDTGAKQLSELLDFTGTDGVKKLAMFNSFLDTIISN